MPMVGCGICGQLVGVERRTVVAGISIFELIDDTFGEKTWVSSMMPTAVLGAKVWP